jgi:carotenoid cleavage dioxygenase-like enzyme
MAGPKEKASNVVAVGMVGLFIAAAKTADDFRNEWVKDAAHADARTEAYFAAHPGRFCAFEGVWYDWDDDETITLGCLEVKGNIREGSYTSASGPRATSNFSISGKYDIASNFMTVVGKDREGKAVKFTTMIYVEDPEYPTQMIVVDKKGEGSFYIWKETIAQMDKRTERRAP